MTASLGLALATSLLGCSRLEPVLEPEARLPASPHEAYLLALEQAGLAGTPLVESWREAAETAIRTPAPVEPPFREVAFYPGEQPTAMAYAVSIPRGQALQATLDLEPADTAGIFLDVFERGRGGALRLVASAGRSTRRLEFEPPEGGDFVLRVQPELLRSARVTLSLLRAATFAFPVQGRGLPDIGSRFGAPRAGGRRSHHGVDIFAPRGTPVVASTDGVVSRVQETNLGGRVVWLRDGERRLSVYYAHLDRQLVRDGDRVRAGDTLGLVGNSGNARTTPPHLHFGIYVRRRGPVDPSAYITQPSRRPPPIRADSSRLGEWVRLSRAARLEGPPTPPVAAGLPAPAFGGMPEIAEALERHTVVRVIAAAGGTLRVRLPDGRLASVQDAPLESMDDPIETLPSPRGQVVLSRPSPGAVAMAEVGGGDPLSVVGRFGGYRLVRAASGDEGWIAAIP